jgi:predicted amidohydrolase
MRVGIAQVRSSTDKAANLDIVIKYIKEASNSNVELLVFPEFLMAYSPVNQSGKELYDIAESIDGEFVSTTINMSREYNIALVITIYEKSEIKYKVYDTAILVDKDIKAIYRKLHLYDALGFKESDKLIAGNELPRVIQFDKYRLGMMICYDLRFPELSRILALKSANVLIIPSAWVNGEKKVEHWQIMLRARAIENGCYIIAPDQTGNIYIGRSMIINPYGEVLLDMGEDEGLGVIDLDLKYLEEVRDKLPLLKNRRSDLYMLDIKD